MSEADSERMVKIDVRVPAELLQQIDTEYERRGYASRSEAIRDALRDWANPSVELSPEMLDAIAESKGERENGDTVPAAAVRERFGDDSAVDSDR